jgi:hypothetical protein
MANTYTLIASSTVGSGGASSIDFTSIPGTYTDLLLAYSLRTTYAADAGTAFVSFNSSTTSFTGKALYGDGSAAFSYNSGRHSGTIPGATSTANTFSNTFLYIPNYTSSNNKSFSVDSVMENNATYSIQEFNGNLWSNSAAITSITLIVTGSPGVIAQYSTAYLYGIKNS